MSTARSSATLRSIVNRLSRELNQDVTNESLLSMASTASSVTPAATQRVLLLCRDALSTQALRASEPARLAVLDVLLAFFPSSRDIIVKCLQETSDPTWYEVHFSLFVKLTQREMLCRSPMLRPLCRDTPRLASEYLRDVPTEQGGAAWMAGDVLGEHCRLSAALPLLLDALKTSRYAAGRSGALHGIAHVLDRLERRNADTEQVLGAVRDVRRQDKSRRVQRKADRIAKGWRCLGEG
jgi:hypothetical protein